MKKLYVGNLNYSTTEEIIRAMFEEHGEVLSVALITDRETGRPKGFGFVEMAEDSAADAAKDALDGKEIEGRTIKVNEARPRRERGPRGGGGGGRW
ncbi:MAG: RNA-binding protein [Planctomycetota bacterium]|nr:MAG: RNA-binding protein [Planctomycetota bacterium]